MHASASNTARKHNKKAAPIKASAIPPWIQAQHLGKTETARRIAEFERTWAAAEATTNRLQAPAGEFGDRLRGGAPMSPEQAREMFIKAGILTAGGKLSCKYR